MREQRKQDVGEGVHVISHGPRVTTERDFRPRIFREQQAAKHYHSDPNDRTPYLERGHVVEAVMQVHACYGGLTITPSPWRATVPTAKLAQRAPS